MATETTYDVGDSVRLTGTFTVNGSPTDPGVVTFSFRAPGDNAATTYTYPTNITRSSVGVFFVDLDLDEDGTYAYRWAGSAPVKAARERQLRVRPSAVL